jgi:hypothetical protein
MRGGGNIEVKGYTSDDKSKQGKICNKMIGKQVTPHHGRCLVPRKKSGTKPKLAHGSKLAGSI